MVLAMSLLTLDLRLIEMLSHCGWQVNVQVSLAVL
jgi:hypothetical protein